MTKGIFSVEIRRTFIHIVGAGPIIRRSGLINLPILPPCRCGYIESGLYSSFAKHTSGNMYI
jgi:hypothetical protein